MREDICTIPISEVFEVSDGCPICRMRDTVEKRALDYIMGAAMMEPDVRQETNRLGFCKDHLEMMMGMRGRLPLALMLSTHLAEIKGKVFKNDLFGSKVKDTSKITGSCFVCERIEWGMVRMRASIYDLYERERDFRQMFDSQPYLCVHHYEWLGEQVNSISKKYRSDFIRSINALSGKYAETLCSDLEHFCSMYDYRNTTEDADWGNSRDAVERAYRYLTSRNYK